MSLEKFKWLVRPPTKAEREEWMKHHVSFPMYWRPAVRPVRDPAGNDKGKNERNKK